jgi:hypothetical protein
VPEGLPGLRADIQPAGGTLPAGGKRAAFGPLSDGAKPDVFSAAGACFNFPNSTRLKLAPAFARADFRRCSFGHKALNLSPVPLFSKHVMA